MFCSSCGQSSAPNALFCHKCGKKLNAVEAAAYPQPAKAQLGSASSRPSGSGVKTEKSLTFKQFQSRKREDRSSHFTKKGKKPKLDDDTEVKINVGIMATKAGALATKRGLTLPLTVRQGITSEELLQKAVEKHSRFNNDVIKSSNKATYKILYGDKSVVTKLPGSEEAFTLRRYKEEIDKPYSRITFYLCTNSDYLESLCSTFDFESDSDESYQGDPQEKVTENTKSEQEVEESPKQQKSALLDQDQHADWMSAPVVVLDRPSSSKAPVVLLDHPYSSKEKEAQCPICCLNFSVSQIEEHADTCSSWLIESEQPFDLISTNAVEDKAMTNLAKDPFENKILLKEQIAQLVSGSLTEYTRVTLRRKFIWNDFKAARHSKIQPNSNLKVVFVGEPCIDDGGPKRELFTELMAIMQLKFFKNGFPVSSSVALSNGDFQLCGEIMAMSILQGGPGPNFMAAQVVSYLVGKPLSTDKNKQHQLKTVADSLVNASSDEEVRELLTSEGVLDVLEEIGYTGIPQKETLFSVKEIVQSICMKDQLTEHLPALLQIQNGLQVCGLLKCIKSHPDVWQPVFESNTAFAITADEFLDQLDVKYSASQIKKDPEIDTFKFFCDTIEKIDAEIGDLELRDIIKWLTGSYDIPPLGFPKKFQVEFVHGCLPGCCCRPTASTCDITIKLPVHINSPKIMEEMIYSSIKESHGFGLL